MNSTSTFFFLLVDSLSTSPEFTGNDTRHGTDRLNGEMLNTNQNETRGKREKETLSTRSSSRERERIEEVATFDRLPR